MKERDHLQEVETYVRKRPLVYLVRKIGKGLEDFRRKEQSARKKLDIPQW